MDDQLIPPPDPTDAGVNLMAHALLPEYLRQNNEPIQWPSQPGKMKPVDPMNPAPWLTADLAGGFAGAGLKGAMLAGPMALRAPEKAYRMANQLLGKEAYEAMGRKVWAPPYDALYPGIENQFFKDIWNKMGLSPGYEMAFRHEIPDRELFVQQLGKGPMDKMIYHPTLFDNYPQLRSVPTEIAEGPELEGDYWNLVKGMRVAGPNPTTQRSLAAHEIQHAIQGIEGLPPGDSPLRVLRDYYGGNTHLYPQAFKMYGRSAGEVEANNVANRMLLDSYGRKAPFETESAVRSDQWVPQHYFKTAPIESAGRFRNVRMPRPPGAPAEGNDIYKLRGF